MIYFVHGDNLKEGREKAKSLVDSLRAKKPNASFVKMDDENFSLEKIEELAFGGQGLFESKCLVFFNYVFQNKEAKDFILNNLKEFSASDNVFVILEGKIDKKTSDKIAKKAFGVKEFVEKNKVKSKEPFNLFSITDAFGRRDKKNAWILFQKSIIAGISPEEIHGIIFWQLKNMIIAQSSSIKDAEKAGVKPFVFNKSLMLSKNFSEEELKRLSSKMVSFYHRARMGDGDFQISLEKFILSI